MTANKALLATHGKELAELAERRVAALLGSASVGGGTPMIETVAHLAATGSIVRLRGLVNATTTFILSAMGRGNKPAKTRAIAFGFQVVLGTLVNAILNDPGPLSIHDGELEERLANCLLLLLQAEIAAESGSPKRKR